MKLKRTELKYIGIFGLTTLLVLAVIFLTPQPIDWSPSFSKDHKIPYGSYIFHELLPEVFPDVTIMSSRSSIYTILSEDSLQRTNYIFINQSFRPDELDSRELMNFVSDGNVAFIAAQSFGKELADTLGISIDIDVIDFDSLRINFLNPAFRKDQDYVYQKGTVSTYFSAFDTLNSLTLGRNSKGNINFIKVPSGRGAFLLSTLPLAFTNYNALFRDNADYAFKALSYLPVQDTIWDEYYKAGKIVSGSPLRFILSTEPLKWAYAVALGGVVLFILFEGKRTQKIVPIVEPMPNMSLEFVEALGRLYYQKGDHKNLADKKITYFHEYLRRHFHLRATDSSEAFLKTLAERSGTPLVELQKLFATVSDVRAKEKIEEAELIQLNSLLRTFYESAES
ncbi:DUF4350 domain-containing protein [bacterium]|nr:DUF4350 domain-containing protein [bacterium]